MMEGRERILAEAMERFMGHGMEIVRQTILKQETTFKEQLRELHRLYYVQRRLMDEMKSSSTVSNRGVPIHLSANFVPIEIRGRGRSKDCSSGLPFDCSSLKLKLDYNRELEHCAHGDVTYKDAHIGGRADTNTNVNASGPKEIKRTFDLERLPEECLDDEIHEETSTLREGQNANKKSGDFQPDNMLFLSLNTSSKEETNSTASVSPSQRNFVKLDVEHQSASKKSIYMEDECFPISNTSHQCLKPLAPSPCQISVAPLETDFNQRGQSSWRFDDGSCDGNRKESRISLNLDSEDSPQEMRRISWDSQGPLNRASSVQQNFMQEVHMNAHLTKQSEVAGGELRQAGQPWWKSFQSSKEVDIHSPGQMLGCFKTTHSKPEGRAPFHTTNHGSHSIQGIFESAHITTMPFQPWRENDLAASCFPADMNAKGHGLTRCSGSNSEAALLSSPGQISHLHLMDSSMIPASGKGCPGEAISGLWSQFPQLHQHQPISAQRNCPITQGSWQQSGLVSSNELYSPSSAIFPELKEPASSEFHATDLRKFTEDLGINCWFRASNGATFSTISVSPPQLPAPNNSLKLVIDGVATQSKLASLDSISNEEIFQSKVSVSSQVDHLDKAHRNKKENLTMSPDQNTDQFSDIGCKEASPVRSNVIEDGCIGACRGRASLATQTNNSISFAVSVSSGQNLPSSLVMSVSENTSPTKKASIIYEGAEESNTADSISLKTLRPHTQLLAVKNVGSLLDVKQTEPSCKEICDERNDKSVTNVGIADGDVFDSEIITPLVEGETLATKQGAQTSAVNSMIKATGEARDRNAFPDVETMISEAAEKTESLQGDETSFLKQQSGNVAHDESFEATKNQIIPESSTSTETPNKPQASATLTSLTIQENTSAYTFSHSRCERDNMLLSAEESLESSRPVEDMASGLTVSKVSSPCLTSTYASDKGETMQNTVLDLVVTAENPCPLEAVNGKGLLLSTDDCHGMQAIISHSSTLPSSTPIDAISFLESSRNGAADSGQDGRICSELKHEYPPAKTSASNKLSPEEASECGQSLSLDESANLAASILVSLLPAASLPPKTSPKEHTFSTLPKSSISSADPMLDQGKCKSHTHTYNVSVPPAASKDHECCMLQTSSLEQVAISENRRKSIRRQRPDFESSSYNMKRPDTIPHAQRTNPMDLSSSRKAAIASTAKEKPSNKSHPSKYFQCVSSLETARSGDMLEGEDAHSKNLVHHGSVVGSTSYTTFEGEGSNQVAKPIGLEISDEDLCSPSSSQLGNSDDETSIPSSRDKAFGIRNWGNSTRKKRMRRHKNPTFHKRQKLQRISLSKFSN